MYLTTKVDKYPERNGTIIFPCSHIIETNENTTLYFSSTCREELSRVFRDTWNYLENPNVELIGLMRRQSGTWQQTRKLLNFEIPRNMFFYKKYNRLLDRIIRALNMKTYQALKFPNRIFLDYFSLDTEEAKVKKGFQTRFSGQVYGKMRLNNAWYLEYEPITSMILLIPRLLDYNLVKGGHYKIRNVRYQWKDSLKCSNLYAALGENTYLHSYGREFFWAALEWLLRRPGEFIHTVKTSCKRRSFYGVVDFIKNTKLPDDIKEFHEKAENPQNILY
jgi:hypothetical protein